MGNSVPRRAPPDIASWGADDTTLSKSEIATVINIFQKLDKDGNGEIDADEMSSLLGIPKDNAKVFIGLMDTNGDGVISPCEFLRFYEITSPKTPFSRRAKLFIDMLDVDGNGYVDVDEFASFIKRSKPRLTTAQAKAAADEMVKNTNSEGRISVDDIIDNEQEFTAMFGALLLPGALIRKLGL